MLKESNVANLCNKSASFHNVSKRKSTQLTLGKNERPRVYASKLPPLQSQPTTSQPIDTSDCTLMVLWTISPFSITRADLELVFETCAHAEYQRYARLDFGMTDAVCRLLRSRIQGLHCFYE